MDPTMVNTLGGNNLTNIQLPIQLCAFKSPTIGLETFTQCSTGKHRRRIVKLKECNRAKNEAIILVLMSVQKTTINAEIYHHIRK